MTIFYTYRLTGTHLARVYMPDCVYIYPTACPVTWAWFSGQGTEVTMLHRMFSEEDVLQCESSLFVCYFVSCKSFASRAELPSHSVTSQQCIVPFAWCFVMHADFIPFHCSSHPADTLAPGGSYGVFVWIPVEC